MWVYKHDLFHRDRPEDLALLRRRTCPTIDGRRQSVSRPLIMKTTTSNPTWRDTPALSESTDLNHAAGLSGSDKKRKVSSIFPKKFADPISKRPSLDVYSPTTADTNFSNPVPLTESEDSDDQGQGGTVSSIETHYKAEEQAMVVLKIASQLAQHARNSKNGSRVSGLVTPTFGASRSGSISSGTLLTYDDAQERTIESYDVHIKESRISCSPCHSFPSDQTRQTIRTINDPNLTPLSKSCAEDTVERLIDILNVDACQKMKTATKLARFCMMTYPNCPETSLCNAIRILLTSCLRLEEDFNSYRSALRPSTISTTKISETEIYYQMWLHEEGRRETIRSFGVFAVNNMKSLLRALDCQNVYTDDISMLERSISVWQKYSIE
jgi:hypothetical protein